MLRFLHIIEEHLVDWLAVFLACVWMQMWHCVAETPFDLKLIWFAKKACVYIVYIFLVPTAVQWSDRLFLLPWCQYLFLPHFLLVRLQMLSSDHHLMLGSVCLRFPFGFLISHNNTQQENKTNNKRQTYQTCSHSKRHISSDHYVSLSSHQISSSSSCSIYRSLSNCQPFWFLVTVSHACLYVYRYTHFNCYR